MQIFSVIMAGGGGTRFWPLSRQSMPKQLLNLSGNDIMINETIKRCGEWIPYDKSFIVTNKAQKKVLDDILIPEVPRNNILVEPIGRNTAPCILYAAMYILENYGDGIMVVLPSDHHIMNTQVFTKILKQAGTIAEETEGLVTVGIQPTFPATGYGYIRKEFECDSKVGGVALSFDSESKLNPRDVSIMGAYPISRFIEKPNLEKAKEYVSSGEYFWNSGIFVWKVSVIIECFKRYLPRIYRGLKKLESNFGKSSADNLLEEVYYNLDSISVDYGILERADNTYVIPGDFGWNDVGSWDALGSIFSSDYNGNIIKAEHIGLDTKGCIIYGNQRLIATVGLENVVVVDTEDALLICPKDKAQEVKRIVELLKEAGKIDLV